jgi:hypothetical protein
LTATRKSTRKIVRLDGLGSYPLANLKHLQRTDHDGRGEDVLYVSCRNWCWAKHLNPASPTLVNSMRKTEATCALHRVEISPAPRITSPPSPGSRTPCCLDTSGSEQPPPLTRRYVYVRTCVALPFLLFFFLLACLSRRHDTFSRSRSCLSISCHAPHPPGEGARPFVPSDPISVFLAPVSVGIRERSS